MIPKRLIIPFCFFLLSFGSVILAQDSTEVDEEWKWHWEDVEEWADFWKKKPTISLHYGFSNIARKDAISKFADNNLIELKLGYTTIRNTRYADYLSKYKYRYLFLTNN